MVFAETKRIMLCTADQAYERVMHKETGYAEDGDDKHGATFVPVTLETTAVFQWMQDIGAEIEIEVAGCRAPPVFMLSTVMCVRLFLQLFEDKAGLQSFAFLCYSCNYGGHLQWQRTSLSPSKAFQLLPKKRTTKQIFETLQKTHLQRGVGMVKITVVCRLLSGTTHMGSCHSQGSSYQGWPRNGHPRIRTGKL